MVLCALFLWELNAHYLMYLAVSRALVVGPTGNVGNLALGDSLTTPSPNSSDDPFQLSPESRSPFTKGFEPLHLACATL